MSFFSFVIGNQAQDFQAFQGMSPRDTWDVNPVFTQDFWFDYCGFLEREFGWVTDLVDDSVETDSEMGLENMMIPREDTVRIIDGEVWDYESLPDSSDEESEGGIPVGMIRATPPHSDWGDELDDLPGMYEVSMGTGTRDDPIDLTF